MKALEVLATGVDVTIQDGGRMGWRRFGIPPSGVMDPHAAEWANRLLDNPVDTPVLELLYGGAEFRALSSGWITVTGADQSCNVPLWRATRIATGERISFRTHRSGMWSYMAIEGGFAAPKLFGSVSVYRRGGIGSRLVAGDVLHRGEAGFKLPPGVAGRIVPPDQRRNYDNPPRLRIWSGPQWDLFDDASRAAFFGGEWTISSQSDRIGYRLTGAPLKPPQRILSEPVLVGSIQVPESGLPIVTMRDGPTVGGYAKLGLVHSDDLPWLCQCAPGEKIRFSLVT